VDAKAQSKALGVLFFAETWERFSYYGMRALLVLYMTSHLRYSDELAFQVYGSYTTLVYATPLIGGMLADKLLGARRAVILGGVLMAFGHFAMAFESIFFWGLALLICGNGFFKPNISTIVGRVYSDKDTRRDRAFYIFYMGINLGALAAGICGWLGQKVAWHLGFGLAGVGMVVGLLGFWFGRDSYAGAAEPPDEAKLRAPFVAGISREWLVYGGSALAVVAAHFMVRPGTVLGPMLALVVLATIAGLVGFLIFRAQAAERGPLAVAMILTVFSAVFFAFFEQAGSSMNLFTERNVDRHVLGVDVPASVFNSVNPLYVILCAPLFMWLWRKLGSKEPTTPLKFGLGVVQLGLGFGAMWFGATASQATGIVPLVWLMAGILLHTTGELCLSPVGLSMITKLSPPRIVGVMMGAWFLASAAAQYVAAMIAQLTKVQGAEDGGAAVVEPAKTVMVYGSVFGGIAVTALVIGVVMCAVSPLLARHMGGVR
jgi:proton-dependent oligopeptide transporter, POT family